MRRERFAIWVFWGCLLGWLAASSEAAVLELHQARAVITIDDRNVVGSTELPYHWDRSNPGHAGLGSFEVPFSLSQKPTESFALYFDRIGNGYEVWLNDVLLARSGDLKQANGEDYSREPRMIPIPLQLLQQENLLHILIRADAGRYGGVSIPVVGPMDEIRVIYEDIYRWRFSASVVVVVVSMLVGMMALLLWLTQPVSHGPAGTGRQKRDGIYLVVALAELAWTLRVGGNLLERPPLPWPWWGIVMSAAYAAWIACIAMFCHHVANWSFGRLAGRLLWGLFISGVLCSALSFLTRQGLVWTMWLGLTSFFFLVYGLNYARRMFLAPNSTTDQLIVAGVVVCTVLVGVRDWLVIRFGLGNKGGDYYADETWMRFMSLLFALALAYIVVVRFRAVSMQARDLMSSLAERVRLKEAELQLSYTQAEQLAREQERLGERARILRDMHDGVGAHISAAIRQLRSGTVSRDAVLQTLRASLDQLKLSIDAMNLPPGDVTAMLASLRYRLEPRLAASGIALQWDVDVVPPLGELGSKATQQLQFMVFEALSNVLQHAHASVLRIELHAMPEGGTQLRVIDNGCGFDPQAVKSTGLASLRERAAGIGAQLQVSSESGRTVVEISLA